MMPQYSVLHIVADDLRDELLSPHVHTPHLDALRATALTFDRAYCQLARCAPSRLSFMTGRYPQTTRVLTSASSFRGGHPTSEQWRTLPEHFRLSGWLTLGAGKVFPSNSNYDEPRSWSPDRPYFPYIMQRCPGIVDRRKLPETVEPTGTWCVLEGPLEQFIDYNLSTAAIDVLDLVAARRRAAAASSSSTSRLRPFYLMLGFIRPHGPWMLPAHAWHRYEAAFDDQALFEDEASQPSAGSAWPSGRSDGAGREGNGPTGAADSQQPPRQPPQQPRPARAVVPLPTARGARFPIGAPLVAAHSATLYPPPQRPNATGALPGGSGSVRRVDSSPLAALAPWLVREIRAAYYASVTWVDEQVSASDYTSGLLLVAGHVGRRADRAPCASLRMPFHSF